MCPSQRKRIYFKIDPSPFEEGDFRDIILPKDVQDTSEAAHVWTAELLFLSITVVQDGLIHEK